MKFLAIARREIPAYLLSPSGYVITALFLLVTGLLFAFGGFQPGQAATLRPVFDLGAWVLLFVCPAITMRSISEELRLGTLEVLMTSPVSELEVILGKFIGAVVFLLIMLLPTALYVLALEVYGRPDYGELLCGYLGMVLAGTAYLASGILASTLTASQAVAFLVALFFWLTLSFGTKLLPARVPEEWVGLVVALDPDLRLKDFSIGLIDSANVVYFLSLTAIFLIAAVKALQARRLG